MKIVKSEYTWKSSWFQLCNVFVIILSFDHVAMDIRWKFYWFKDYRQEDWWDHVKSVPELIIEVLTLGYYSLERR